MGNKIKTVIASILKPVDDTRMYEKFGLSLQQTNRYEVNIIGFNTKNLPKNSEIKFFPIYTFRNTSLKRLLAGIPLLKKLNKIAPKLIIATTFEVLISAVVYKMIRLDKDIKIVYDVQENYALNFISNHKYSFIAQCFAKIIRLIEKSCQTFITLNILAEPGYTKEISFSKTPHIIIGNKYKQLAEFDQDKENHCSATNMAYPKLILNGTISENYGIYQALAFTQNMKNYFPEIMLNIIGHVTNTKLLKHLLKVSDQYSYINTTISEDPIPHSIIIKHIKSADFGIVAHQPIDSIKNCFPTRIYEYMALNKPFMLQNHSYWTEYCTPWDCSINIDFNHFDAEWVAEKIRANQFYGKGYPDDIFWEKEAGLLIEEIDKLSVLNA